MDIKEYFKNNKGFTKVPNDLYLVNFSGVELRIYLFFLNKHKERNPSHGDIGELLGFSRQTIVKAIASLVSKGYLIKEDGRGEKYQNIYRATWPH